MLEYLYNEVQEMTSYSSKRVIQCLQEDGWYLVYTRGDHYQFKHPAKPGKITVPHPNKDLPKKLVSLIFKQAGINGGK